MGRSPNGLMVLSQVFNERCAGIFKRNYTLHQNSNGHRTTNESGSNVEARAEDSCSSDNDSDAPPAKNKCNLQCAENHDATEVIACKRCEYYINDSVYMSFNMCFFNEDLIRPEPLHLKEVGKFLKLLRLWLNLPIERKCIKEKKTLMGANLWRWGATKAIVLLLRD